MPTDVPELLLGPLLRHTDRDSAALWVEVDRDCCVLVRAGEVRAETRTFAVHGHHYALVELTGLEPGSVTPYDVTLGAPGETPSHRVWPPEADVVAGGATLPPSVISALREDKHPRLAFGSCRTSVPHDEQGNNTHGVDAMRTYALAMARATTGDPLAPNEPSPWPDLLVLLGDQVYADETSEAMREFIASRRSLDEPPWEELRDYEEYSYLYRLAWSEPANRWLLSTLPSAMIFDDHDIRDDWNTSQAWKEEMESTSWWHDRIVAGLSSYWVYQHLGNLSPKERADDEVWRLVKEHDGPEELDLSETLDAFAERTDQQPESYRWSYARDIEGSRLVMVDSRAARVLDPERRAMLDDTELAWLDEQLQGDDLEHVFIGTSVPFLLPSGLHHLEAFGEAVAEGAWGPRAGKLVEQARQVADLEHWGAFQDSFRKVAEMVVQLASGERGRAPRSITFLSGDVHHSYVHEVSRLHRGDTRTLQSRVFQLVCSPIRNPLQRRMRFATAVLSYGVAGVLGRVASRSAHVDSPPFRWKRVRGPWFDNNLATAEVTDDGLSLWWATGDVGEGGHDAPTLRRVCEVTLDARRH